MPLTSGAPLPTSFAHCGPNYWYYVDLDGAQQGPVDESTLKAEYRTGEVDGMSLLWRPGQKGGWLKLDDLSSLKTRITQASTPSSPQAAAAPPPVPSPQKQNRRHSIKKPNRAIQPKAAAKKPKGAGPTAGSAKKGHRSALTFSQEAQFDTKRFEDSKKVKTDLRMAKIREAEALEAAAGDAKAAARRLEAEKMRAELAAKKAARNKSGWEEHFTPERLPYYQNRETGDLSWEKPDELKSAAEKEQAGGEWLWMPDKKEAFVPAKVSGRNGGKIQATSVNGKAYECAEGKEAGVITNFHSINMREDDLVQMLDVNEGSIIHCLRERFAIDEIYTAVGDILIALNPYVRLPLYTPEKVYEYSHRGTKRLPPHVFDTASRAYMGMCEYHKDYSILISGESGAGKTEATKQVLIYLSEVAGGQGPSDQIAQRVLSANPGLEAFGNAKTLRNNNSSRFGKFMQVYFNQREKIAGCNIENYLLEKSRVVMQLEGERNFHIFYMLCTATKTAVRSELRLENPNDYYYLDQSGCITADGINDQREFEDVMTALKKLEFKDEEIMNMWKVTAAVLHNGNIKFDPTGSADGCVVSPKSNAAVKNVAELLGCDLAKLKKTLVRREITLRGETVAVDLNVDKAQAGRDALSKSLYGKLFDWLVIRTNKAMAGTGAGGTSGNFIGILDIFGFEIFKSNSFEQLCINFCNEKLQQHFNRNTFVLEEDTYTAEGIEFDHIEYVDNQDILNMIEKKPKGILVILDDEVSVPRGSDMGFYNKICKIHKGNPRFLKPRMAQNQFVVNHYAGGVTYTIDNMLEKNKDKIEDDMAALMTTCTLGNGFVSDNLYGTIKKEIEQKKKGGSARGSRYLKTQSSVFRSSLNALMKRLNGTCPNYIRCIKTNAVKKPGVFTAPMCLEQLRYAGVFEAVSIRKQGFPFRFLHEDFYKRFRCITKPKLARLKSGFSQGCRAILKQVAQRPMAKVVSNCKVGQTMILYRSKESAALELLRAIVAEKMASVIQGVSRGYIARQLIKELRIHVPILRAAIASRTEDALKSAIEGASSIWFEIKMLKDAKFILRGLVREQEMKVELVALVNKDPDSNYNEYEKMINEMEMIQRRDAGAFKDPTALKCIANFKSVEAKRDVKGDLQEGISQFNKIQLEDALKRLQTLKVKFGDFCPALEKEASSILKLIQAEEALALKIKNLVDNSAVKGTPGRLDASKIDTSDLRKAIAAGQAGNQKTAMLKKAIKMGNVLCNLREAVKEALSSDDNATGPLWARVRDALVSATGELSGAGKKSPELDLIQADAAARSKIEEIADKIRFATTSLDEEWLTFGIDQAVRLQMDTHQSASVRECVEEARKVLRMITDTKILLREGIDNVDMSKMSAGLELASRFAFETDVVMEAEALHSRCKLKMHGH